MNDYDSNFGLTETRRCFSTAGYMARPCGYYKATGSNPQMHPRKDLAPLPTPAHEPHSMCGTCRFSCPSDAPPLALGVKSRIPFNISHRFVRLLTARCARLAPGMPPSGHRESA